jgi:hypothetical protein
MQLRVDQAQETLRERDEFAFQLQAEVEAFKQQTVSLKDELSSSMEAKNLAEQEVSSAEHRVEEVVAGGSHQRGSGSRQAAAAAAFAAALRSELATGCSDGNVRGNHVKPVMPSSPHEGSMSSQTHATRYGGNDDVRTERTAAQSLRGSCYSPPFSSTPRGRTDTRSAQAFDPKRRSEERKQLQQDCEELFQLGRAATLAEQLQGKLDCGHGTATMPTVAVLSPYIPSDLVIDSSYTPGIPKETFEADPTSVIDADNRLKGSNGVLGGSNSVPVPLIHLEPARTPLAFAGVSKSPSPEAGTPSFSPRDLEATPSKKECAEVQVV